jgi:enamine deaminase RidA (YjgF/YER057c/UK114 family)
MHRPARRGALDTEEPSDIHRRQRPPRRTTQPRHRSAIGMGALPFGIAVEIEAIFEVE